MPSQSSNVPIISSANDDHPSSSYGSMKNNIEDFPTSPHNGQKSANGMFLQRFIPARLVFVFLGFLGFNLAYAYKVVLSESIVNMVNSTDTDSQTDSCPISNSSSSQHTKPGDFQWDETQQGQVLGAFFYGYVLTQIPAGIYASKFGGKWIFGLSLLISGILSLLGPITAKIDYRLFMVTRIGQGLSEGAVFPCMNAMIANWMPTMERSRAATFIFSGSMIGTVLTLPLAVKLGSSTFLGGWPASFYILGAAGVVWFLLWTFLIYESPEVHPFISQSEHDMIKANGGGRSQQEVVIPYRAILTSKPVIALTAVNFGQNWAFLTILTLMPTYMDKVLHMKLTDSLFISGLPYLGQAIAGWILSFISDKLRQKNVFSITVIRKINMFIAYMPGAVCMVLIPFVRCDSFTACLLLILVMTFNGGCHPGINSTHVDMAPDFAGTLMGITNSIGNIPGFIATALAKAITKSGNTIENWAYIFYIAAGVNVLTSLIYLFFCTAQEQPWGRRKQKEADN